MEEGPAAVTTGSAPENFVVSLGTFEGPLDLLLYLIEKNRFTLDDVQVRPIIDQYLAYMERARRLDMALAAEFLDMASYLIWIKSRILLPRPASSGDDGYEDPAGELREMLVAYRAVKAAARSLGMRPMLFWDAFPRGAASDEREVRRTSLGPLLEAVAAIRARTRRVVMDVMPVRFSVEDIMVRIQAMFSRRPRVSLLEAAPGGRRGEIIAALMAALEMSRLNMLRIVQKGMFSCIYLLKRAAGDGGGAG